MVDSKISIITVCLNCEELIERTIKSVIDQTYANVQYIIIDGGSTDNTLNIIKKYENKIDVVLSERDDGIYDAMNKGIKIATGDLVYFLNGGDFFYNDLVIENVLYNLDQNNDCDILYGDWIYYGNNGTKLNSGYRRDKYEIMWKGINHQAIFTRRSVFEEDGYFDKKYEIYGDYDWLLRSIIKYKRQIRYINSPIVYYLWGGKSMNAGNKYIYEKYNIRNKYLSLGNHLLLTISYPIVMGEYIRGISARILGSRTVNFRP